MNNQLIAKRDLLDSGWLAHHGQEAAALELTVPQMEMCKSLGITPAQFKASSDRLSVTEAMVNGQTPDMEIVLARAVDLHKSPEPLTTEQSKFCYLLGISGEAFKAAEDGLSVAGLRMASVGNA